MSAPQQISTELPESWRIPRELGFSVFPVLPRSKEPACKWKCYQAEHASLAAVELWAAQGKNVGIATGEVSRLLVLDLDSAEAIAEAERRGLPDTATVRTSKGLHVYFRHPGGTLGNRAGIFPGADIRGDGGYVVAPGSVHESGFVYQWENPPGLFELAPPPEWLLSLLRPPEKADSASPLPITRSTSAYADAALDGELAALRKASVGNRNDQLNKSTFALAQLVAGGVLNGSTVQDHLRATATAIGLDEAEIEATMTSAWTAGIEQPRAPEERNGRASRIQLGAPIELPADAPAKLLPLIDLTRWTQDDPPPREFAWGDWIPLLETTMLTGRGGIGKSLFEQMLFTCMTLGLPFLGMETRQGNALYITAEDNELELWRRQKAICASLGVPLSAVVGKLHLVSLAGEQDTALATFDDNHRLRVADRWRQVEATAEAFDIRYSAFDNATDMMAGDHNDIHEVAEFVNLLTGFAINCNGVAMILHHPNKAGDDWLGSVAWHNKVRSRLIIKGSDLDGDTDGRTIENPKANYGPSGGKIAFRWFQGAFTRDEDLPPNMAEEIAANVQASHDNAVFLTCLRERVRQRRPVSDNKASRTYAPLEFSQMAESKHIGKRRLEAALDRLYRNGTIKRGFLFREDGKDKIGLREVGAAEPADLAADHPLTPPADLRRVETPTPALSHPISKDISGAAHEAAAPSEIGRPVF